MREAFSTVLVEPNVLLREGLARILAAARFRVLGSVDFLDDVLLNALTANQSVLLVIGAGDDPHATARQIERFKDRHRTGRVAVVAHCCQSSGVLSAFRAGANAYLVNVTTCAAFVKSLELVMLGATIMPPEVLSFLVGHDDHNGHNGHNGHDSHDDEDAASLELKVEPEPLLETENGAAPHLSAQEQRILNYLVEGASNKVIARKIDIAEATVKVHIKAILRKVRVHNRTQAAVWAMNRGTLGSAVGTGLSDLINVPRSLAPVAGLENDALRNGRQLVKLAK